MVDYPITAKESAWATEEAEKAYMTSTGQGVNASVPEMKAAFLKDIEDRKKSNVIFLNEMAEKSGTSMKWQPAEDKDGNTIYVAKGGSQDELEKVATALNKRMGVSADKGVAVTTLPDGTSRLEISSEDLGTTGEKYVKEEFRKIGLSILNPSIENRGNDRTPNQPTRGGGFGR